MATTPPAVIIATILATGMTTAEAADHFHVSERWIRTLKRRHADGGSEALAPRSRRPHTNPRATPDTVIARILELRHTLTARGTDAGAHTIHAHLEAEGLSPPPAVSTIHRILVDHGHVQPQPQKRPRSSWKRFEADQPNETWQMDYSDWKLSRYRRVYILTILDDHSRFIVSCRAFPTATVTNVIDLFTQAGQLHGYPQSTLTDNGRAFTTRTHSSNTRNGFEQILLQLGIAQKNGKPYHPQTQGKVERFHQTLKRALKQRPPAESLDDLNNDLAEIIRYYNTQRPHRALGRSTPAAAYQARPKASPAADQHQSDYRLRADKVGKTGKVTLRWKGDLKRLYVGRRWVGIPIAIICVDNAATVVATESGEHIGRYTLIQDQTYFSNELASKPTRR